MIVPRTNARAPRRAARPLALLVAVLSLGAALLACPRGAFATTYYIDWSTGDDANNGTSQTACGTHCGPWKRAPGMNGFAGSYRHATGDRFVFRGGVTWPHEAFRWLLDYRDGDPARPDYYGVDRSWYAGASFSRPVFDLEHQAPTGDRAVIHLYSNDPAATCCAVFEGFEIRNLLVVHGQEYGAAAFTMYQAHDVTIRGMYIHGWTVDSPALARDNYLGGVVQNNSGTSGANNVVEDCEIEDGEAAPNRSGYGVIGVHTVRNNTIHDLPNGILGGIEVSGNTVHDITSSFDPSAHENGIYIFSPGTGGVAHVYGNHLYNVLAESLYLSPCFGNTSGTIYAFNNVSDPRTGARPIEIDTEQGMPGCGAVHLYNNTLVCARGAACVRVGRRNIGLGTLVNQNEHYITDSGGGLCVNTADCDPVAHLTDRNNVTQTTAAAAAQGFTAASVWAPGGASAATVDVGLDATMVLTTDLRGVRRPQLAGWDVGAYEYTQQVPDAGAGSDASASLDGASPDLDADRGDAPGGARDVASDALPLARDGASDAGGELDTAMHGGCRCRAAAAAPRGRGRGGMAAWGTLVALGLAATRRRGSRRLAAASRR